MVKERMLTVRRFCKTDSEQASAVLCKAFKSFMGNRFDTIMTAYYSAENLLKQVSSLKDNFGESAIFVAEENEKVVGVVKASATSGGLGSFDYVGVDPDSSARGIGSLLMSAAETFWIEKKQRKIITCVSAHNKKAIIYYLKHDFIPEGYCRDHFREGVDEIMLCRFLKPKLEGA